MHVQRTSRTARTAMTAGPSDGRSRDVGNVVPLPTGLGAVPAAVDLSELSELEFQVIFYAAGATWVVAPNGQRAERLTPIVLDTVERLGVELVRQVAEQAATAARAHDWSTWRRIWPSMDRYGETRDLARVFRRQVRQAMDEDRSPLAVWAEAVAA
jgi:hypothetical protein